MGRNVSWPLVLAFALASCGGDDAAKRDTTPAAGAGAAALGKVTAHVGGRTLSGHCQGRRLGAPAVMLESGIGADQNQLYAVEQHLVGRTLVCAYDRAGVGESDPPPATPRPVAQVVSDTDAFIAATKAKPPYFLVGHSAGGAIAFLYAQAHPDTVAGFVSMNPVPPSKPWLSLARHAQKKGEYEAEVGFYRGENPENMAFTATGRMLSDPLPPKMPYAVMFDEDCNGDTAFCRRILAPLTRVTKSLAAVGEGGTFVRARGAGHNIYGTDLKLVNETADAVLKEASGG